MTFTSKYSYIDLCSVLYLLLHLFIIYYHSKLNNYWYRVAYILTLSYYKKRIASPA